MVFRYRTPWHPAQQLRDEVDRLFTGFLGMPPDGFLPGLGRGQPAVNLWEEADRLLLEAELPGVKSEQVEISVAGAELTLKVQRSDALQDGVTYHRQERPVGTFTRVVRLPADIDADQVTADLRDGVLTITLPKAESAKPRKIAVTPA